MQQISIKSKNRLVSAGWTRKIALIIGLGTSLTGCGDYGPDMKAELAKQLSAAWQVDSLHIDEWEITSHEPRQWHYRFTAKAAPTDDLYKKLGVLNNTVVLQPTVKKGALASLAGTAAARLNDTQWHSHFVLDRTAGYLEGEPATAYGENIFIIGSPKRDAFLAAAETALQQSEAQLSDDQALLSRKIEEWKSVDTSFRESVAQTEKSLQDEQQQLRLEQGSIDSTVEREVRAANAVMQAELREQLEKAGKERDVKSAAIAQAYHAKKQALRRQFQELSSRGRSHAEHSQRYAQLNEEDSAIERQFRDQREQAQTVYLSRLKEAQQEFEARRARLRDDITQNVTAGIERSNAVLQEKSQQQQGLLLASSNQLAQQRAELDQLSTAVQSRKKELAQQRALLEQITTRSN